jgi:hypothetical protein
LESYSKALVKALYLLQRNIRVLEKDLSNDSRIGESPVAMESLDLGAATFELDTLELTRRGRQEQARVMAELMSAGAKWLALRVRKILHAAGELSFFRASHSLKGN